MPTGVELVCAGACALLTPAVWSLDGFHNQTPNLHHFDVVRLKPLIDGTNGRHPCRIKRHNLGHKSGQGTRETDNRYECAIRALECVFLFISPRR